MTIDLSQFRFILGAPSGICVSQTPARFHIGQPCEECGKPIAGDDKEVWFCSYFWLGKRKKGCATWHKGCLKENVSKEMDK